jgi:hypothetical protein
MTALGRCECRDAIRHGKQHGHPSEADKRCSFTAVRMMTVPPGTQVGNKIAAVAYDIPMCEPCYEYASKAGAR